MIQTIPNSHRWTDLKQLMTHFEYDKMYANEKKSENSTLKSHLNLSHKPITIDYLLIGFKNVLKDKTKMVFNGNYEILRKNISVIFTSVEDIINYLEQYNNETNLTIEKWSLERFKEFIAKTIECGFNLKSERKMERTYVYKCIDTERQYQDLRWSPRRENNETPDESKPPAEWINYIEFHIAKAKREIYLLNEEEALAHIRKVAALAVRCLEIHGCPERVIPKELLGDK